jgi:hypothetical protein
MVAVTVGVGLSEVALGVRVEGSSVAEGSGVKVNVAVRMGVSEGCMEGVNVQVGGSLKGVRAVDELTGARVGWGVVTLLQPNKNRKTIKQPYFENRISASKRYAS